MEEKDVRKNLKSMIGLKLWRIARKTGFAGGL